MSDISTWPLRRRGAHRTIRGEAVRTRNHQKQPRRHHALRQTRRPLRGDRADDADASVNLGILALACHARRRGWAIRVESSHLPPDLLRAAEPVSAKPRRGSGSQRAIRSSWPSRRPRRRRPKACRSSCVSCVHDPAGAPDPLRRPAPSGRGVSGGPAR
ncbi:Imm49 family immunity protein [Streptomyces misionensis]|uniref:Imm49 family immunity protein n=1 Tax=Streptomyces misionensis TaxID=67331 RepID=UPI0036C8E0D0